MRISDGSSDVCSSDLLILMDIQMPSMDGYETTRRIRKQMHGKNRSTPVLAFTAEPYSEELKKKVADHSIGDLITKPFDAEMLIDKIGRPSFRERVGQYV